MAERFWNSPPFDSTNLLELTSEGDLLKELDAENANYVTVAGDYFNFCTHSLRISTDVRSALVSPINATALLRAMQTAKNRWIVRIPSRGDDLEIKQPPYTLLGWLIDSRGDHGEDEKDPLSAGLRKIQCRPSRDVRKLLNLERKFGRNLQWICKGRWPCRILLRGVVGRRRKRR